MKRGATTILQLLAGGTIAVVTMMGGWLFSRAQATDIKMESIGERTAVLEANYSNIKESTDKLNTKMDTVISKLDHIK